MRKLYTTLCKLVVLAIVATTFASCLEKYPDYAIPQDKAINTLDDLDQAAIGVYDSFKSSALYSGYLTLLPDVQCDLVHAINGYTNTYGNIWRWDILATNSEITSVYAALYQVIARANYLLEYAPRVEATLTEEADFEHFNQICGEAYFARAMAYSELIKLYCKSYESKEEAEEELGVVLVTKYNTDEPMIRSSLQKSYERVIEDLDLAARLMEVSSSVPMSGLFSSPYFNEYTAYALRARVALYMKDYDAAIDYSTRVIDSGYYILSSTTAMVTSELSHFAYMWQYDDATEIIWKVGFTPTSYGGALGRIFCNYDYSTLKPDYVPSEWVLNLYNEADLRASTYFQSYQTGHSHGLTWPLLMKYFGNMDFFSQQILHTSMPKPLRLAEQYLIRAEAYAMKGNYSSAGNDLGELLAARYASFSGSVTLTEANAMQLIEEERIKELYMEGFRLMDLKRWHKGFERKPQEQSLEHGSSLKIDADDVRFVWPIPQHELESPGSMIEPNESNK